MQLPPGAPRPQPVAITWPAGWSVTDARLRSYEGCPRRFFYTHVLGLGGARKSTAFSQTHDCLYDLIRWLADAHLDGTGDLAAATREFDRMWAESGPLTHPFVADYRRLADRLVEALVRLGAGKRFRQAEPLAIDFVNGRVIVHPDEMTELPDGSVVLRRVRTGYKRSDEYDRLEYTLYALAGRAAFGASFSVEALHLTDENVEAVAISSTKLKNRQAKSEAMLAGIAAGRFPPDPDPIRCPRCPHFFVCDATGRGSLALF